VHPFAVPAWLWFAGAGVALIAVQFLAFRDLYVELDAASREIARASKLLGTELRDARHRIELTKATGRVMAPPAAYYPADFELPSARWQEEAEVLAARPDLYATVEKAYVAVGHASEVVGLRRTRASGTLGVRHDDGLDEAYEAAGEALDALGEDRGEAWESEGKRVLREIAAEIVREATIVDLPNDD
jgi:hypothetical protein